MTPGASSAETTLFLVGTARSGSTLLRHVLNRSPLVTIAPETHFMRRAQKLRLEQRLLESRDEGDLAVLVEALYGIDQHSRTGYWAWLRRNVAPEHLVERLRDGERSLKGLFRLLIEVFVDAQPPASRPPVVGEKTPSHLWHVDMLAAWFPAARFIHTLRDPRAVYASELRRRREGRWGPTRSLRWVPSVILDRILAPIQVLQTTLAWRRAERLDQRYRADLADRYLLVRFEDLVRNPERHLRRICDHVGIPFDPSMLATDVLGSSFHADRHGPQGFDPAAIDRWRDHVGAVPQLWFGLTLRAGMRRHGYL